MGNCPELRKGWFSNHTFIGSYAIMGIPAQIKTDNSPAYISKKMKWCFAYYTIKHITGIPNNPTGQAVIERSNWAIKDMLNKQKRMENTPRNRLHNALLTLNFLTLMRKEQQQQRGIG